MNDDGRAVLIMAGAAALCVIGVFYGVASFTRPVDCPEISKPVLTSQGWYCVLPRAQPSPARY